MVFLYQCLLQIHFCSVPNEKIWIEERLDDWMTHVLHCGRANSRSWNATRSQDAWLTSAILGGSSAYLRLILQWKSFSYYWLINPKLIYFNLVLVRQIAVRKQPSSCLFFSTFETHHRLGLAKPLTDRSEIGDSFLLCVVSMACPAVHRSWRIPTRHERFLRFFGGSRGKMAWNATNLGATNGWNWSSENL